jgi:hypothetical protein
MKKIELLFKWNYNLPSIVLVQFQIDLAKLNDESYDMSEFPCFYLDLKTGEILGVSDEIATGDAYQYSSSPYWLIEGNNWWIGYNESEDETYLQISDSGIQDEIFSLFDSNGRENFNAIVAAVCDFARNEDLHDCKVDGIYQKYIHNDGSPSLG